MLWLWLGLGLESRVRVRVMVRVLELGLGLGSGFTVMLYCNYINRGVHLYHSLRVRIRVCYHVKRNISYNIFWGRTMTLRFSLLLILEWRTWDTNYCVSQ